MRLWSIHPSLLDRQGLVALWREALLAQKVIRGKTIGYRYHPQLKRFCDCPSPVTAISTYLWAVHHEAARRGYAFDASRIARRPGPIKLTVSRGQLRFEVKHLRGKLERRDPKRLQDIRRRRAIAPHPLFEVIAGPVEAWERRP
jgi:hypothetical protein